MDVIQLAVFLHNTSPCRNFLKSKWGMEEFMMADTEVVHGRTNLIILVLKDKIRTRELDKEMKKYVHTFTFIDATKNLNRVQKRLRQAYL